MLDGAAFDEPATKQAAEALAKWGPQAADAGRSATGEEEAAAKSFRNIPRVASCRRSAAGVADVIGHASLIVTESALEVLEARVGEVERGASERRARRSGE